MCSVKQFCYLGHFKPPSDDNNDDYDDDDDDDEEEEEEERKMCITVDQICADFVVINSSYVIKLYNTYVGNIWP